ncbi:run and fyve domain-containing protein 4 [Plakobranchus ocellatus]|uniref:Run and fyve domain-containing protein 4 n=1 Tax=Plakobranchus ocellatus TaxID=259542 RepID=A0AAV4BCV6_9GAST|nr:run and fyve domain-containing protein 4 [Plakobranchus ocellatus]
MSSSKKTSSEQGRGRLFLRACLVKKDLASIIRKLRDDEAFLEVWYDPRTSIIHNDILSEIFLSLLAEVQKIPFSLYLKNASFLDDTWEMAEYRDYEFVPCEVLGVHLRYINTHLVVTDIDPESVAAEDGKVHIGDVMDELYTESLRGAKRGRVRDLFQLYKGMPVYVSFIKARLPDGQIYRPISRLLRQLDMDMNLIGSQGTGIEDSRDGQMPARKPAHALLQDEEQDEIPVHGPDAKAVFTVVYSGAYPLGEDGRVDRIHDSIESVTSDRGRRKEVVKIEMTETGVEVRRCSDSELILNHSYTEVSACGRRTDMLLFFGYIAGETTCNMAKDFKCYVFETDDQAELKDLNEHTGFCERTALTLRMI